MVIAADVHRERFSTLRIICLQKRVRKRTALVPGTRWQGCWSRHTTAGQNRPVQTNPCKPQDSGYLTLHRQGQESPNMSDFARSPRFKHIVMGEAYSCTHVACVDWPRCNTTISVLPQENSVLRAPRKRQVAPLLSPYRSYLRLGNMEVLV